MRCSRPLSLRSRSHARPATVATLASFAALALASPALADDSANYALIRHNGWANAPMNFVQNGAANGQSNSGHVGVDIWMNNGHGDYLPCNNPGDTSFNACFSAPSHAAG